MSKKNQDKVVIIRSSNILIDSRVLKMSTTLNKQYNVLILSWDREANKSNCYYQDIMIKFFSFKAPYGNPKLLLYYPFYWFWILVQLSNYKPTIIHSCDFDTIIPSYLYKLLLKTRLIFDSFDRYAMAFILPKYKFIYKIVNFIENIFTHHTDALISVNIERLLTFGNYSPKITEIIMNCPQDYYIPFKKGKKDITRIVHAGGIGRERGLILLMEAIKNIDNIELILAGKPHDDVMDILINNQKVKYVGILPYKEAIQLEKTADIIPIFYDPTLPITKLANPNKLFEAMMLSIPVITNVCEEIINEENCGLYVAYDKDQIKKGILYLMNNFSIYEKMGENGRKAYVNKYNWKIMEIKLLNFYNTILKD